MNGTRQLTGAHEQRPAEREDGYATEQTGRLAAVAPLHPGDCAWALRDRGTLLMLKGPTPGAVLEVPSGGLVIGRASGPAGRVDDPAVSRTHARLLCRDGAFVIEDLDSANGTFVDGVPVRAPAQLRGGERIQLGSTVLLRFDVHDSEEQTVLRSLYHSAVRDPLTGVYNRRCLEERMHGELSFALRHRRELALLMLDIDHFKSFNDAHGHAAGDVVLKLVARSVRRILRPEDLMARYGGEEFCVLVRGVDESDARILAERIRSAIGRLQLPWSQPPVRVTVSVGIATLGRFTRPPTVRELIRTADTALYRAKERGRNRCEANTPSS